MIVAANDHNNIYKGAITKIHPIFDEILQSYIVDANIDSSADPLPLGSKVQVNILIKEAKAALVIPTDYLLNGDSVSLSKYHQKVAVKTGIKTQDYIQILSGIDENSSIELVDQ